MTSSPRRTVTLDVSDPMTAAVLVNALRDYAEVQSVLAAAMEAAADVECIDYFDMAAAAIRTADTIDAQLDSTTEGDTP